MKIYLAGPMSGIPHFNFPEFYKYAYTLRREGHTVFSPAEQDQEDYGADVFDNATTGYEKIVDPRSVICKDMNWIIDNADAIYVMPNWRRSKGVAVELALADFLDIPIKFL